MMILFILIIIFLLNNFLLIEHFDSSPILSPNILKVERNDDLLDITFEKDTNDNIGPNDSFKYELYYKDSDFVNDDEMVLRGGELIIDKNRVDINSWNKIDINCEELRCNHILSINSRKNYYLFILVNLRNRRSPIKEIQLSYSIENQPVYSPDIMQITKNNSVANVIFKRSGRDTSLPDSKFKYEVYYKKDSEVMLSESPSPSESDIDEESIDMDEWEKKVVICNKLVCQTTINNLDNEPYHFFIVQIKNSRSSTINNIVKVSDTKPYRPLKFRSESNQTFFQLEEETPCTEYSYEDCPDELTGTILSRCYRDEERNLCLPSVEESYF